MNAYYAAVTRRSSANPLLHAISTDVVRKPGQTTVPAACGARVARAVGVWDAHIAHSDRACPKCREATA